MGVKPINSYTEFKEIINKDKPVVIDFWATWCGPCRIISPIFEKLSDAPGAEGVEFYKVDVDEQKEISQEAGIRAMPTFVLFKEGNKVSDVVGAIPGKLQDLVTKAQGLLASPKEAEPNQAAPPKEEEPSQAAPLKEEPSQAAPPKEEQPSQAAPPKEEEPKQA